PDGLEAGACPEGADAAEAIALEGAAVAQGAGGAAASAVEIGLVAVQAAVGAGEAADRARTVGAGATVERRAAARGQPDLGIGDAPRHDLRVARALPRGTVGEEGSYEHRGGAAAMPFELER